MCGLNGWISPRGGVEADLLLAMRERLRHRGPDGAGLWVDPERRVGLAHRRLSIVDLSSDADQPMVDEQERTVLVFNGEIYNHAELRVELEAEGARFRTDHSDTEVILRGYRTWGLGPLLERLNGMFAFALLDRDARRLFLVRDRLGIKPLYFARVGEDLLFASEAKALFAHPDLAAEVDRESLAAFLSFRSVPAPRTLFDGVECLGPGELVDVRLDQPTPLRRTWWDPLEAAEPAPRSLAEAEDELERRLETSIERRLRADVPVGLFLSGGVDSALLLELASQRVRPLETFTVGWPGHPRYDEAADAASLAGAAGAHHHPVPLDATSYRGALSAVAWHQDEPIAAPVCTAVWYLSQAARRADVPVVLAGEGADELFVGYKSWLQARDLARWDARLPDLPGRLLRKGAQHLAASTTGAHSRLSEVLARSAAGQPLFWGGAMDFTQRAQAELLAPGALPHAQDVYRTFVEPLRDRFLRHADAADHTLWMTYVDLRFRLPQLMLPRLDKMGMAFSVEGRVPFLDHEIAQLVCGLPPAWRVARGRVPKPLLKAVAARHLPHEFVYREKKGFRAPVAEWNGSAAHAGGPGLGYGAELVEFARETGLFRPRAVANLLKGGQGRLYFGLLNFMLWHRAYVQGEGPGVEPADLGAAA